jgi:hypothetical protein
MKKKSWLSLHLLLVRSRFCDEEYSNKCKSVSCIGHVKYNVGLIVKVV